MIINDDRGEFYGKGLFLERYIITFVLQADETQKPQFRQQIPSLCCSSIVRQTRCHWAILRIRACKLWCW